MLFVYPIITKSPCTINQPINLQLIYICHLVYLCFYVYIKYPLLILCIFVLFVESSYLVVVVFMINKKCVWMASTGFSGNLVLFKCSPLSLRLILFEPNEYLLLRLIRKARQTVTSALNHKGRNPHRRTSWKLHCEAKKLHPCSFCNNLIELRSSTSIFCKQLPECICNETV